MKRIVFPLLLCIQTLVTFLTPYVGDDYSYVLVAFIGVFWTKIVSIALYGLFLLLSYKTLQFIQLKYMSISLFFIGIMPIVSVFYYNSFSPFLLLIISILLTFYLYLRYLHTNSGMWIFLLVLFSTSFIRPFFLGVFLAFFLYYTINYFEKRKHSEMYYVIGTFILSLIVNIWINYEALFSLEILPSSPSYVDPFFIFSILPQLGIVFLLLGVYGAYKSYKKPLTQFLLSFIVIILIYSFATLMSADKATFLVTISLLFFLPTALFHIEKKLNELRISKHAPRIMMSLFVILFLSIIFSTYVLVQTQMEEIDTDLVRASVWVKENTNENITVIVSSQYAKQVKYYSQRSVLIDPQNTFTYSTFYSQSTLDNFYDSLFQSQALEYLDSFGLGKNDSVIILTPNIRNSLPEEISFLDTGCFPQIGEVQDGQIYLVSCSFNRKD